MLYKVKKLYLLNLLTLTYLITCGNSNEDNNKDENLNEMEIVSTVGTLKEERKEEIIDKEKESKEADIEIGGVGKELAEKTDESNNEAGYKQDEGEKENSGVEEEKMPENEESISEPEEKAHTITESKEEEVKEEEVKEEEVKEEEVKEEEVKEVSSPIPKEGVSEESAEIQTYASPMLVTDTTVEKEEAPPNTYAVWNSKRKICLLAKFNATFSIIYPGKSGEQKLAVDKPGNSNVKGKCESTSRAPLLQVSWQKYVLTLMFNKSEENWVLTTMELTYDTSEPLFDGAVNVGKKTARSKSLELFETPLGKSYYCVAQETVLLYTANKQVVTAKLKDLYLQPYGIEEGKFSPAHRCNKVVIDGPDDGPFVQDETVPLAVGCTLALITLIILVGFSIHRAYNAAKVDYNTME